jgi:PAS domain S-box-containing protein
MTESMVETSKESSINLTEAPIQVLNVDDDSDFLKITKRILEVLDAFKVDTALSVDEAMDKMKRTEYDVIVSDYQVHGKSGLDFLKELRANGNNVPFVLFMGKGRESLAIQALNFGADQYFNKLGDPETVYGELAHGIRQIVEKRRAEKALKDSEAKCRSFFENARDAAITLDLKGNIIAINKAVEEYGFKKSEVIGKNMRRFVPRRYWPKLLKDIIQLALEKTVEGKIEINTPTGKRAVEYSSSPITIGDNVVGIQSILKDVSEREKIEETLKESEENYRNIVELAPDSIMTFNLKGVITSCNTASMRLSGYSKDELLGKHFSKAGVLRARDIPRYLKILTFTIRGKVPKPFEVVYRRKDGSQAFGDVRMSLMKEKNKIVGIQAIMRDITERKKSEEALQESEERFRNLFESSREGIIISGPEGKITRMNSAASTMLGYDSPEELVGIPAVELYQNPKTRETMFKEIKDKGYVENYEMIAKKRMAPRSTSFAAI